jgi:hypothetical protein
VTIGARASGLATVNRTATSGWADGTAECLVGEQDGAASGTAAVNRTTFLAFMTRNRCGAAVVTLDGEALATIVDAVDIVDDLETAAPTASFIVSDPRAAVYAAGSLTWGEKPVTIDLVSGEPGALVQVRAFEGITEAPTTTGVYRARGQFRCVGTAAAAMAAKGCLRIPAFSGMPRGAVLVAYGASCVPPVTIINADHLALLGRKIEKPFEVNSTPFFDLAKTLGEYEGWTPRSFPDGSVEMLLEDELLNGPPVFHFTPGTYFSCDETAPTRPTTRWVFSGTMIEGQTPGTVTTESTIDGTDESGKPTRQIVRYTANQGTELIREVEEWETFRLLGVSLGPEALQLRRITRVTSTWATAVFGDEKGHYTNQLTARQTTIREVTGTRCDAGHGYEWTDTFRYLEGGATLLLVSNATETMEWNGVASEVSPCTLRSSSLAVEELFMPMNSDNTYAWGTETAFHMMTTRTELTRWDDLRAQDFGKAVVATQYITRYVPAITDPATGAWTEMFCMCQKDVEEWRDDGSGSRNHHTRVSRRTPVAVVVYGGVLATLPIAWPTITETFSPIVDEWLDTPVPSPPVGSINVAQHQTRVVVKPYSPMGWPFRDVLGTDTLEFAEDAAEYDVVWARRMIRLLASFVSIVSRLVPQLLPGDVVLVTDPKLSLSSRRGIVTSISPKSQEISTGKGRMTTIVRFLEARV